VEGRQPTGLWIELLRGADPEKRAAALSAAGLRVSTWAPDPYPDRLPRHLDECTHLLVGETEAADVTASYALVPPADESATVVPMHRYPRPSQGICTGERTNGLLLVLITPREESQAQALRDWADFIHLRHIAAAAVPGYTTITPYEHRQQGSPRFCHFYEMTTDDARKTFESMTPLVSDRIGGPGTPGFDDWAMHPALRIDYCNTFTRLDAS
jgi:hypothetical protein